LGDLADTRMRDALVQLYRESVWPKFGRRYGFSWTPDEPVVKHERPRRGTVFARDGSRSLPLTKRRPPPQ
jgi:hypothetical protein